LKKKRLFVDKGQPHGTVVLNWHGTFGKEFTYFAEAFYLVAKDAVAKLRQNHSFGLHCLPLKDFQAYPIVFLYRHAFELYMKAVILIGSPMLSITNRTKVDRETLLKTHSLEFLRQELERIFEAYEWDWDLGVHNFQSVSDFRKIISEFQEIDAKSSAFRYPVDTKGGPSLESHFRFNLFEFCEILDDLLLALEGACIGAYEELQVTFEQMEEIWQYER